MLGQRKLRRHKSLNRVAAFTTAFIGTPRELAGVRISMAITAELVRHLLFEIAASVAFLASNISMPAPQWEIRQIVIKRPAANIFPALGRMTLFAFIAKTSTMRILVAWCAISKRYTGILHKCGNRLVANFFSRRLFGVAFVARDTFVLAREHELRAIMRKFCSRFPAGEIMAALTSRIKLSAMLVRMTGKTFLRQAEKSFGHPHVGVVRKFFLNIFLLMAISTRGLGMFAF
jgi:hypothetical protein